MYPFLHNKPNNKYNNKTPKPGFFLVYYIIIVYTKHTTMHSNEDIKLLLQAVSVILALQYTKGYMTGEYRNLMAVVVVAAVLMIVDRLVSDYEGADTKEELC
jgi:uncharacterized membrane protein YoaT (DUF817 family)